MSEEIMMILNLLDQGKIDAEEAERLLEAVNPSPYRKSTRGPGMPKDFMKNIEKIPQIVSEKLAELDLDKHLCKSGKQESAKYDGIKKIAINQMSGDTSIKGIDEDYLVLKDKVNSSIAKRNGSIAIKNSAGNLDLIAPSNAAYAIQSMSGDLNFSGVGGKCMINAFSGDVSLKVVGGSIKANVYSGDTKIIAVNGFNGKFNCYSGDIDIKIVEDIDMKIVLEVKGGGIDNQTDMDTEQKGDIVTIGDGEQEAKFKVLDGDVKISIIEDDDTLHESKSDAKVHIQIHTEIDEDDNLTIKE